LHWYILTTQNKQEKKTPKKGKNKINKVALDKKKTHTQRRTPKPKLAVPSTSIRTVHMCVLITVYQCGTHYSTEQF